MVVEELLLDENPSLASNATTLVNDVLQLNSDHPGDPGNDHTIHPPPGRNSEGRRDSEDMVIKGVEPQREKVAPTGLGGGSWDKEDGD